MQARITNKIKIQKLRILVSGLEINEPEKKQLIGLVERTKLLGKAIVGTGMTQGLNLLAEIIGLIKSIK